ncbi:MAG: ABC transporter ATP-binding protein [Candidatus Rokubacteria bacterium]|nr:ABC transporter ATP-binding protein [Candidatus Rokubacteria bacterium]
MAAPVHVRLIDVVKRFGATVAVAGVTLDIRRGSLTTILGPSGCGKTTLLRLIAGFLEPDAGEILIDGLPQRDLPPYRRKTSTVFQEYALFPHMTVFDNVAYGLRLRRLPRAAVAEKVRQMLGLMRLDGLETRFPRELSGGQQQRVALARSLIVEPEVLLMDEPLSNLDAKLRISVRAEIRELQERLGITTVYVTHDQEEALAISDTIAVMQRGTVRQVGTPREIYEQPSDPWVAGFVGQVNLLRATVEAAPGAGRLQLRIGALELPLPAEAVVEPGRDVLVVLRPEAIRIAPVGEPRDGLTGQVLSATYLGTTVRYQVELGPERLTVDDPDPGAKPLLRGPVVLSFDPARLRLWPAGPGVLDDLWAEP